jgi:predicted metal-dependent HD superfamily phosphohydrolase
MRYVSTVKGEYARSVWQYRRKWRQSSALVIKNFLEKLPEKLLEKLRKKQRKTYAREKSRAAMKKSLKNIAKTCSLRLA